MMKALPKPILLGNRDKIERIASENGLELHGMPIIDSHSDEMEDMRREFGELLLKKAQKRAQLL